MTFSDFVRALSMIFTIMLCSATLFFTNHATARAHAPIRAEIAPQNTFEKKLDNGLRIIVREDHRAPTVAHMVWYRTGSMDEVDGRSGLAHVLEHMMFKGTPKVGPGEFSKRVAAAGGRDNAFTSRDYTAYFQQIPKEKLAQMMELEADRMQHLTMDPEAFSQEVKVVMEERRMRTDDDPDGKLFEQSNAVAYQAHPYRRPIIGWMSDLQQMQVNDAKNWHNAWYMPNNAYLVIVGDVKHKTVFKLAQKYYGPIKARPLPKRAISKEPKQQGLRRISVQAPAKLPRLIMAYKAPVIRDVDKDKIPFALDMLSVILDGYDGARLNRHLVREQRIALAVGASYDPSSRGPGMFYLSGTPSEGKTVHELETAIRNEIIRVQKEGIDAHELTRAKAQIMAAQVYKLDSLFGQAMEIGRSEAAGIPWPQIPTLLDRLQSISSADIKEVANKYFNDSTLTIGSLDPQPLNSNSQSPAIP